VLDPPTDKTRPVCVWTEAKPGTALSPVFIEWLTNISSVEQQRPVQGKKSTIYATIALRTD